MNQHELDEAIAMLPSQHDLISKMVGKSHRRNSPYMTKEMKRYENKAEMTQVINNIEQVVHSLSEQGNVNLEELNAAELNKHINMTNELSSTLGSLCKAFGYLCYKGRCLALKNFRMNKSQKTLYKVPPKISPAEGQPNGFNIVYS